jgi:hypothetical protein
MRLILLSLATLVACSSDDKLTVNNASPVALITSHSTGDTVREGSTATFMGSTTDTTDEAESLTVTWFQGETEACAPTTPLEDGTTSCEITFSSTETLSVRLEVRDPKNATGEDSVQIDVTQTGAPITELTISGEDFLIDAPISFTGTVSDEEDAAEALEVWLESSVDGRLDMEITPSSSGDVAGSFMLSEGIHDVALWAMDTDGKTGFSLQTIEVGVVPNSAPTVSITLPEADTEDVFYTDMLIELQALAHDDTEYLPDLTATWESSLDGVLDIDTSIVWDGSVTSFAELSQGSHVLTIVVTDPEGLSGEDSVLINVGPPNSAPDCEITQPLYDAVATTGETINFEATVFDVDISSDWLSATWSSDKDGDLAESTPTSDGEVSFATDALSVDSHTITLTVSDELGATCTDAVLVQISTPPTLTVTAPLDGAAANQADAITFAATATDEEDAPAALIVQWHSSLDGIVWEDAPDSVGTSTFILDSLSRGSHTLTITVTDTDGLYATAVQSLTINGAPTAPVVSITPAAPQTGDGLLANIDTASTDPDGDPLTYTYAWFRSGVASEETSATLSAVETAKGQTWTVVVTPTDGSASGSPGSASVTIINTAPELSSATISPSTPSVADTLTCTAGTATDADGDTVTLSYAWTVSGVDTGVSSPTLTGGFSVDEPITCTVTPNDGEEDGTAVTSGSVVVTNTPPEITSAAITPDTARTDDTLAVTAATDDADGDAVSLSYVWAVNGATVSTAATLDGATHFDKGDAITVTLTPNDGTEDGDALTTAPLVVDNTPPSAPEISITEAPTPCGDDWWTAADGLRCLQVVQEALNWSDAQDACADLGGELARIEDSVENDEVAAYAESIYSAAATLEYWVGLNDLSTEGSYAWPDGGPVSFTDWAPGEPNDVGGEDCVQVEFSRGWNDMPCSHESTGYACQMTIDIEGLLCQVDTESTDADGDTVSYTVAWDVEGTSFEDAETTTLTGDTVPTSALGIDETWTCTVTPNDGEEDGEASSSTLTTPCTSLYFDGVTDVSVPDHSELDLTTTLTMAAWVNPTQLEVPSGSRTLISKPRSITGTGYALRVSSNTDVGYPNIGLNDGLGHNLVATSSTPVVTDEWVHIAGTLSGGMAQIYVDGELTGESSWSSSYFLEDRPMPLYLGRESSDLGWTQFEGYLYDAAVWDVALSASQIGRLADGEAPIEVATPVAYWPMDEPTFPTIRDEAGAHHGTLTGGSWGETCP